MASALVSDSSVCPHVHKATLKQGREKSNLVPLVLLPLCATRPPRDDHTSMHLYMAKDSHLIPHYGNEDMRET